jgi:hypothetical protein
MIFLNNFFRHSSLCLFLSKQQSISSIASVFQRSALFQRLSTLYWSADIRFLHCIGLVNVTLVSEEENTLMLYNLQN